MSVNDRIKNAKRNILFGMLNKFFSIILPFITGTFLIQTIGAEYLGVDSLFTSLLQILNLSELGFSSAVVFSMYEPMAYQKTLEICALLNFFRKIYVTIGLVILTIGICLMPFLANFIKGEVPSDINLYIVYLVFLINTASSYLLFGYKNSVLNASQRVDIISNCASVSKGLMAISQGIALYLTYNYYYFVILLPIFTVLNNLLIWYYSKKLYPEFVCRGSISNETLSSIKKRVAGLFATKFCTGMRNSVETLSVSSFIGLTATAIYSNYYMTVAALTSICAVFANSILAGVGNRIVTNSQEENYKQMRVFDFSYLWVCGVACTLFAILLQPFMKWWVGEELMYGNSIYLLFPLYFYTLRIGDIKGVYQDASGLWWENRYRAIVEIAMVICLNLLLVQFIGAAGVIVATVSALVLVNIGFGTHLLFKHYFKNGKLMEYYIDHTRYFVATLISVALMTWISNIIGMASVFSLIICVCIGTLLPNTLYYLFFRKHECFIPSIKMVFNILGIHRDK